VGHFAIQFAKARGAVVIATCSANNKEFVRSLGADQVIDYKSERFEDLVNDVDLVFDLVAGNTQERSWSVLKDGGTMVSTLARPSERQSFRDKLVRRSRDENCSEQPIFIQRG
jgi:NADPH:quinone reductase-like Zn-dependent oxidoreductase